MKDHDADRHLTPETFVDVLDGAPVAASHRMHLRGCERCRCELEELTTTLALLRSDGDRNLTDTAGPDALPRRAKGISMWLVAAAAILVALVVSYPRVRPDVVLVGPDQTASDTDELLPPVELDEAFQVLEAMSEELDDSESLAGQSVMTDVVPSQIDELTPEERGVMLERLAEEMRSHS